MLHQTTVQSRHVIDESSKVGEARRDAHRLAQANGLDDVSVGRVAIAATELANNLLRHGGGGELLIAPIRAGDHMLLELMAIDRGRGMLDVERCLRDGYSTAGTAGTGLGAVRRLASEFDIYSKPNEGTVVMARFGAKPVLRFGVINIAVAGEVECGDSWSVASDDDTTAMMVVDGLGHGTFAAQAAQRSTEAFLKAPFDEPRTVLERAHRASSGTRGAAAACARARGSAVQYAGVGNISGSLVTGAASRGLMSHNGTLGHGAPRLQQIEYERPPHSLMVMHSDGVSARWDLSERDGLLVRHPAVIAAVLYRDHGRSRDDATVVVVDP